MKTVPLTIRPFVLLTVLLCGGVNLCAQGTAFTYQGRLMDSGNAFTGNVEFQATLWDAVSNGNQVAANSPAQVLVGVTNGLFTMPLNFGANFPGANRWLQLEVRTNIGSFTTLAPRQPITPTPYAITASNLTGTLPAAQLSGPVASANLAGTYSSVLILNNAANSFGGSGTGLTGLDASQLASGTVPDARLAVNVARTNQVWLLGGNAGTTAGTHFLGTTDNQAVELKVNGMRALRLEPNTNGAPNVIGGSSVNFVGTGIVGATIGGGGATNYSGLILTNWVKADLSTVSGGAQNTIQTGAVAATIGGGAYNMIQDNAADATIGGGLQNTIQSASASATIGGGDNNTIQPNAAFATIGGGVQNTIQTSASYAAIGGGDRNTIQVIGGYATIGGGRLNTIGTNAALATIGGGDQNSIQPNAEYATIGGGLNHTIQVNGDYATIPGGTANSATNYAFAAGRQAKANHTGAFVWGDSTAANIVSATANSVTMRAAGGYRLYSNGGASAGVSLAAGGTAWGVISDRNLKKDFARVDPQAVLEKLVALPITQWHYQWEEENITPHIGPMAQDFKAAFYPGADDKSITTQEADGVALAAIQGLNQKLEERLRSKDVEIQALKDKLAEVDELKKAVARLERLVSSAEEW